MAEQVALGDAAARGASITLFAQLYKAALQLVATMVLARMLSPDDFGLIAMVLSVIGISEIFRDFGLSSAAIQAKSVSTAERTNLFWANTGLGVSSAVVVAVSAPLIAMLYADARVTPVVVALAGSFVLSGMVTQYTADMSRRLMFRKMAIIEMVSPTIALGIAVVMALMGAGYWALVVQQLVSLAVLLALSVAAARWWPGVPRRDVSIRHFMKYGVALFGTQVIAYLTKNIDNIAIGVAWGATPLGYYDRAYQLLMAPLRQINAPMTRVALPVLSRVHDDPVRFERYLLRAQIVGGYVTATVFALAASLAKDIVLIVFGADWLPIVPIFTILALGGVLRAVSQISYWIFLASGHPGAQLKMYLVTRPLMILVIVAGVPWGAMGVAVGSTVAYSLHWIISLIWSCRVAGLRPRLLLMNTVRILVTVSIPAGVVSWLVTLLGWPSVPTIAAGLLAVAVYLIVVAGLSASARRDLVIVVDFAVRAVGRRRK
ncbi:lipopolysaccharide biosynthesis protein [Microbacterium sp.]|uniref:lipopolysaccharide biosynthesis protein n=1 Tax=Microbacterium sp. TaxID=51671 RepID=UPI0039E5C52E